MNPKPIKITKDQIRQAKAFRKLNEINQKTMLRKENVERIQHGVNVSSHIGFADWEAQAFPSPQIKDIVFELLCILKISEVLNIHPDPLRDERAFLEVSVNKIIEIIQKVK